MLQDGVGEADQQAVALDQENVPDAQREGQRQAIEEALHEPLDRVGRRLDAEPLEVAPQLGQHLAEHLLVVLNEAH